jgi:hypothetical protein
VIGDCEGLVLSRARADVIEIYSLLHTLPYESTVHEGLGGISNLVSVTQIVNLGSKTDPNGYSGGSNRDHRLRSRASRCCEPRYPRAPIAKRRVGRRP